MVNSDLLHGIELMAIIGYWVLNTGYFTAKLDDVRLLPYGDNQSVSQTIYTALPLGLDFLYSKIVKPINQ
tara:strand:- start:49 stop:258 length:210 start_codon:yes stop_codon:yes gene_type:complete